MMVLGDDMIFADISKIMISWIGSTWICPCSSGTKPIELDKHAVASELVEKIVTT